MGFKDMVESDIKNIFLNPDFFAIKRTVIYDGQTYSDIPVVIESYEEYSRAKNVKNPAMGLYKASVVIYIAFSDIGKIPEKGMRIKVNDQEGGGGFFSEYYIESSTLEEGLLNLKLEEYNE